MTVAKTITAPTTRTAVFFAIADLWGVVLHLEFLVLFVINSYVRTKITRASNHTYVARREVQTWAKMVTEQRGRSSNWKLSLAFGVMVVLLALGTATGAVSLSNPAPGSDLSTGLAYSGWVLGVSILLGGLGMFLIFQAGRDRGTLSPPQNWGGYEGTMNLPRKKMPSRTPARKTTEVSDVSA